MLLDEIIDILGRTDGSLTDALLKTKILLHQIGKKDLVQWVNNELTGYPDNEVPPYRIVGGEVRGHLTSIRWNASNQLLPIMHLSEEQRERLTTHALTQSIQIIEESVRDFRTKGGGLQRPLPAESGALFRKGLAQGVAVFSAWCTINMHDVEKVVVEVRSRLLDFLLELRDAVGMDASGEQLSRKAASVDTERMFSAAIYGSGNTVVMGSQSTQTVTVSNAKGDLDSLIKVLQDLGLSKSDLTELRSAISADEKAGKTPVISDGKTGRWFTGLLGRAGKGAVNVSVDLLSSTVVKALAAYVGMAV